LGLKVEQFFIYALTIPNYDKRGEESVQIAQAKQIQIMHKAPVISSDYVETSKKGILLVCTEEQIKTYILPSIRAKHKMKLTALEGLRIKSVTVIDGNIYAVMNNGKVRVYNLGPKGDIQPQLSFDIVNADEPNAISSMRINKSGILYYKSSVSQIDRYAFNLAGSKTIEARPNCRLNKTEDFYGVYSPSSTTTSTMKQVPSTKINSVKKERTTEESTLSQDEVHSFVYI